MIDHEIDEIVNVLSGIRVSSLTLILIISDMLGDNVAVYGSSS